MARAKKIIRNSLIALVLLLIAGYFAGNAVLTKVSRRALTTLVHRGKQHGIEISEPQFRQARLTGLNSTSWLGLSARLQFPNSETFDQNRLFDVRVGQIKIRLTGSNQVALEAKDIEIDSTLAPRANESELPESADSFHERITANLLQTRFELKLFDPLPGLENVLPEIVGLISAGKTMLPVVCRGSLSFSLKGAPAETRFEVRQANGAHFLTLEAEDLRSLSSRFDEALTDAEIAIITAHPLRAPRMLRIKNDAESTAKNGRKQDALVPEDAYRHVLWSYLLTQAYGEAFSKKVTDAHEEGDTGNTQAERQMDYHNNEIGRRYAQEELKRKDLLARVLIAPEIIREPR